MTTLPTLAVSLPQPIAARVLYAGAMILGRVWETRLRGDLAIHAADVFEAGFVDDWSDPLSEYMLQGGIVGIVEMVDCVARRDRLFDYIVRNPRPVPLIPCRASIGLFRPATPKASK